MTEQATAISVTVTRNLGMEVEGSLRSFFIQKSFCQEQFQRLQVNVNDTNLAASNSAKQTVSSV
jgi:hypothetical protein